MNGFERVSRAARVDLAEIAVTLAHEVEAVAGRREAEVFWRQAAELDPATALRGLRLVKLEEAGVELAGGALLDKWCFENERSAMWLAKQLEPMPNPSTVSRWRNGATIGEGYARQLSEITGLDAERLMETASAGRRAG